MKNRRVHILGRAFQVFIDEDYYSLSFTIYLEIVLSIKSTNQKHGGFDVTVSLFSWGHPLTTAHA